MTQLQELKVNFELNNEARTRQIPPDLRPNLLASWLTFLQTHPHLLLAKNTKHRCACLVAFIQGWLRGSVDVRLDQELGRQQHQGN